MKNLALVTWTHDSYNDIFPVYFGNIEKFFPSLNKSYVLINELSDLISDNHLQCIKVVGMFRSYRRRLYLVYARRFCFI